MGGPLRPREALSRQAAGRGRVTRPYPSHEPSIRTGPGPAGVRSALCLHAAPAGGGATRRTACKTLCKSLPRPVRRGWRPPRPWTQKRPGPRPAISPGRPRGDPHDDLNGRCMTRIARAVLGRGRRRAAEGDPTPHSMAMNGKISSARHWQIRVTYEASAEFDTCRVPVGCHRQMF